MNVASIRPFCEVAQHGAALVGVFESSSDPGAVPAAAPGNGCAVLSLAPGLPFGLSLGLT